MSLFDAVGLTPAIKSAAKGFGEYINDINRGSFVDASFGERLRRTVVGVVSVIAAIKVFNIGFPLAAQALNHAPMPLLFSAVALIGAPLSGGLSLFLFIPIAVFSLPLMIQSIGATFVVCENKPRTPLRGCNCLVRLPRDALRFPWATSPHPHSGVMFCDCVFTPRMGVWACSPGKAKRIPG